MHAVREAQNMSWLSLRLAKMLNVSEHTKYSRMRKNTLGAIYFFLICQKVAKSLTYHLFGHIFMYECDMTNLKQTFDLNCYSTAIIDNGYELTLKNECFYLFDVCKLSQLYFFFSVFFSFIQNTSRCEPHKCKI